MTGSLVLAAALAVAPPTAPSPETRGAHIVLKVADYDAAASGLRALAARHSGEVTSSRTEVDPRGKRRGWATVRLPADRLPAGLADARGLGKLYSETVGRADHATEYATLARRSRRLSEHEARLANVLAGARRLRGGDLLYLQERLFRNGLDQEQLAQRRADLERAGRSALLTLEFFEPEPRLAAPLGAAYAGGVQRARSAWQALLGRGATAGAFALVFLPLWLPALLLGLLLTVWSARRLRVLGRRLATLLTTPPSGHPPPPA